MGSTHLDEKRVQNSGEGKQAWCWKNARPMGCQEQPVFSQLDARCGSAWPCHFRSIRGLPVSLRADQSTSMGSEMWGASHAALRSTGVPWGSEEARGPSVSLWPPRALLCLLNANNRLGNSAKKTKASGQLPGCFKSQAQRQEMGMRQAHVKQTRKSKPAEPWVATSDPKAPGPQDSTSRSHTSANFFQKMTPIMFKKRRRWGKEAFDHLAAPFLALSFVLLIELSSEGGPHK